MFEFIIITLVGLSLLIVPLSMLLAYYIRDYKKSLKTH